ncbi:MAG: hypothetical protein ACP5H2_02305 [Solirubrobacteraceae bacterium]
MTPDHIRTARRALPTVTATLAAVAFLAVAPTGADLPAALFRTDLFRAEGLGVWNNWWYGGQYVLAYGVLFSPLAALASAQLVAALACVATAAAFEALCHRALGDTAWVASTWLGAATVTNLLSGRLSFALGLSGTALVALLLQRRIGWAAAGVAILTALTSPVAAVFAALAGLSAALTGTGRLRSGVIVAISSLTPMIMLEMAFPDGGIQPFASGTFWPLVVAGAGVCVWVFVRGAAQRGGALSDPVTRTIFIATALYLAGCTASFTLPTPLGSNAARLGDLVAGPVAALLLVPTRQWRWLVLAALPLSYLQVHSAVGDLQKGWRAPYDSAAYYRPLIAFLKAQPGARERLWRVEVPFTAGHWEAYRLALVVPLARGWERQTDIADDPLFYHGKLTAARYHHWLQTLAVRYVAVADAPVDYAAAAELDLIRARPTYLRVVAHLRHWTVYAVRDPTPIASGAAQLTALGPDWMTFNVRRTGNTLVRVRYSPYWQLAGVPGCVRRHGDFTELTTTATGKGTVTLSFAPGRIGASSPRCN